jgi:nitroreductase
MAPVVLLLVSDISRFRAGAQELKLEWAAIDTGIVSQNISIFCAATGLGTRPRASMDREKLRSLLQFKDTQYPLLNHPVGYKK